MGVETEYAFAAFGPDGAALVPRRLMGKIEQRAKARLPHLPSNGQRGMFLHNGSRFYRDHGGGDAHQEFTTPECANPWDIVRYILAGERMLLELAGDVTRDDRTIAEALYFKHNVDYGGSDASWGCHENVLTRSRIEELIEPVLPHLVSRVIYTGAGGFNPLADGIEFTLSPRVAYLSHVTSTGSEHDRPIFHLKDEPLGKSGNHRLHIICGESLCSHTAMWLRSATTCLVVALADAGFLSCGVVELDAPLEAMRSFVLDPTCKATTVLKSGKKLTAIEIQRHYLGLAETHARDSFMPPWAEEVCRQWRAILDRLQQGAPDSVDGVLDWAIKHSLYRDHVSRQGLDWETVRRRRVTQPIEALRQELFEIETRFGQLGEKGIFSQLERAGVLQHQFPGVDNIEHAMHNPPAIGRANLRGRVIHRLHGHNGRYVSDWTGVWDLNEETMLDLSDPFETTENWKPAPKQRIDWLPPLTPFEEILAEIHLLYCRGRFEDAAQRIRQLEQSHPGLQTSWRCDVLTWKARVQARRGFLDAVDVLNEMSRDVALSLGIISDYLLAFRFRGLEPRAEMEEWIQKGLALLSSTPYAEAIHRLPGWFQEHWGCFLLSRGHTGQAEQLLESARREMVSQARQRFRTEAVLANAKRILGKTEEAARLLDHARKAQESEQYDGDLADFTLPNLAKLQGISDPDAATRSLARAKHIQVESGNRLGLARTFLLEARFQGEGKASCRCWQGLLELRANLPALAECKLLARVLERWDSWTGDPAAAEHGDVFWGV